MSSSEQDSKQINPTTRVFVGGGMSRESMVTVEDLQGRSSLDRWSKEVEQEVMRRVQEKAAAKAKEVLAQAREEANEIRNNARVEGFNQGIADAQAELQQAHQEMAASLGQALANVQQGRDAIWQTHKDDLITLVRVAVERICNLELDQQRRDILAGFMEQAVEALEKHSGLTITVHPDDEPTIQDILAFASQQHPQLQAWRVKSDPAMQPGGLLVESDHGIVDNTMEGRRAIIEPILEQLELPLPQNIENSFPQYDSVEHPDQQQQASQESDNAQGQQQQQTAPPPPPEPGQQAEAPQSETPESEAQTADEQQELPSANAPEGAVQQMDELEGLQDMQGLPPDVHADDQLSPQQLSPEQLSPEQLSPEQLSADQQPDQQPEEHIGEQTDEQAGEQTAEQIGEQTDEHPAPQPEEQAQ